MFDCSTQSRTFQKFLNNFRGIMKKLIIPLLSLQMIFGPLSAQIQDKMANQLDAIKEIFNAQYAPREWKEKHFGLDLEKRFDEAKAAVYAKDDITVAEFQNILRDCLYATRDYHVCATFYSTELAFLPFSVKSINGKYIITSVDEDRLSRKAFPINVGDELVAFDGKNPADIIEELKKELPSSNPETDQTFAEFLLTLKARMIGMNVPSGPVYISVKPLNSDRVKTYQLIWVYYPETITNGSFHDDPIYGSDRKPLSKFFETKLAAPYAENLRKLVAKTKYKAQDGQNNSDDKPDDDSSMYQMPSFVPTLGEVTWRSDKSSPYLAYIYKSPSGKNVGYVRIGSFISNEENFVALASIIEHLEANTDALVIDEVDNPGGYVFQVYSLASMLTEKPLETPKHRIQITQADVCEAYMDNTYLENIQSDEQAERIIGSDIFGYPVTYQFARFALDYNRFIINEWNAGRRLTNPTYISGIDHINPHPRVNYTKEILILVNEMDFSGGDFFPAIMQDNKRATIFGARTAGAGGILTHAHFPNRFGIMKVDLTGSIAERADHNPIENLGVTPDILYALTENDIRNGYQDYAVAVNAAVENLLASMPVDNAALAAQQRAANGDSAESKAEVQIASEAPVELTAEESTAAEAPVEASPVEIVIE